MPVVADDREVSHDVLPIACVGHLICEPSMGSFMPVSIINPT